MLAPGTLLFTDRRAPAGRHLLFSAPHEVLVAHTAEEAEAALARAEALRARGAWLGGYLAYELGYLFEPRLRRFLPPRSETPLLWLGAYDAPKALDRSGADAMLGNAPSGPIAAVPDLDADAYAARFARVADWIAAGDTYQVNLTFRARFATDADPAAVFRRVLAAQPAGFAALLALGDQQVLSWSPELFVSVQGRQIVTRPMKGTIRRGRTTAEDAAVKAALSVDRRMRAENLMIVDLLRNDLSRLAEPGSVEVTDLFTVETYPTLHTLTSGITARLPPQTPIRDLLAALFPCGSVTGAPKIRAMEIIHALEETPRGVYTGAIGWFEPGGDLTLSVAIRTATIDHEGRGVIGVGGGVVADSEAGDEYREALLKLRFLDATAQPVGLIETLLWEPDGGYVLVQRHLDRLADSARYLDIPLAQGAAADALAAAVATFAGQRQRVRLLLDPSGALGVTATPLPLPPNQLRWRFCLAPLPMQSSDPRLFHKTTARAIYDVPRQAAHDALGVDEVVFCNERGEVTEGSFTNLFLRKAGRLLTPALRCGLLPGTLRAELLARGEAEEAVLTPDDFADAEEILLGNSVRGLVPAQWITSPA